MKTFLAHALLLCIFFSFGCRKQDNPPPPPTVPRAAGENLSSAPVDYLGKAAKAEQAMEKTVDTASLNNAVQLFNAQEGRYPNDLNELVAKNYFSKLPTPPFGTKLQYDSAEGKVAVVKE